MAFEFRACNFPTATWWDVRKSNVMYMCNTLILPSRDCIFNSCQQRHEYSDDAGVASFGRRAAITFG